MFVKIEDLLKQKNILHHVNEGVTICSVKDQHDGVNLASSILYQVVDVKTSLYLSGGKTPRELYEKLAKEEILISGAVGQVDERYGEPFHANSNQKMIRETELLRYLQIRDIPFYPILQTASSLRGAGSDEAISVDDLPAGNAGMATPSARDDVLRKATAQAYDEKIRSLNAVFQKSVAILGIGDDGHTAGIPAGKSKLFEGYDLVAEYNDESGKYAERVTMTFLGLSMMDLLLVLVFGSAKKNALKLMFQSGSEVLLQAQDEQEIPARFYKRPDIALKTIIITDQQV